MIKRIGNLIKRDGCWAALKRIATRSIAGALALPFAAFIILLLPIIRIRFIQLFSARIGHYSFNTEAILSTINLKLPNDRKTVTLFYHSPGMPICNSQLHRMWKRTIPIIPFSILAQNIDKLLQRFGGKKYRNDSLKKIFEPGGDGRDRWGILQRNKKCHLSFIPEEKLQGEQLLRDLGIPPDKKFVCLLARDSHYLNDYMPAENWGYHDFRDANIQTYRLAALALAEQGYYVVRMGKIVKDQFNVGHPHVIDYANSPLRSDFLDIYLSANCFFFISTCTGLDSVARVFRKPLVVTNLGIPDFDIWHPWDLFIPKKMQNVHSKQLLTLREMNAAFHDLQPRRQIPRILERQGLRFIDNSPEEIRDVVLEMVERLTQQWNPTEEEERLQQIFWQDFPKYLFDERLPSLELPVRETITMRVGTSFLKNNLFLMDKKIQQAVTA